MEDPHIIYMVDTILNVILGDDTVSNMSQLIIMMEPNQQLLFINRFKCKGAFESILQNFDTINIDRFKKFLLSLSFIHQCYLLNNVDITNSSMLDWCFLNGYIHFSNWLISRMGNVFIHNNSPFVHSLIADSIIRKSPNKKRTHNDDDTIVLQMKRIRLDRNNDHT